MCGLGGLLQASYEVLERCLLCDFVERCHAETNNFHVPVGEMTITLDDVSNLLHLPIVDQFYRQETLDADSTIDFLVQALRVDCGNAYEETRYCRGAHVRLSWLRDVCTKTHAQGSSGLWLPELTYFTLSVALYLSTRVLYQLVCFILNFFVDLRLTGGYSWARATLTHMYGQLGDCSYANTK